MPKNIAKIFHYCKWQYEISIKEANSVLYNFIWNGKDKVKLLALISDMETGGLKMLDIQSMICAKRVTCLKKLLEDYSSPWKTILGKLLLPIGRRFVLHCNFQTSKLKTTWSEVNGKTPSCYEQNYLEQQVSLLWQRIDVQKRYSKLRLRLNFCKQLLLVRFLFTYKPEKRFFLISIINSIPAEWRALIKASTNLTLANPIPITQLFRWQAVM